ncbi:hypothetical protein SCATT_17150 [Streptantibioticus cattleyicolor NRRL 8057 = DSM 46488]|uniref:Uncharacterized protein n=1 Tax=Streptantibioticus cattleyicolor (strain ATCC 35852 / DSM 46488 / JCM 4925 / NBRC 14057 / NRRL 8057) TaxID=1003195 RepID=G8WP53_STREN|nr:hypothetical protein SCATT_17150 [Streptantibioticus cattleyicolor NRRL 8057 = DSM 46488]
MEWYPDPQFRRSALNGTAPAGEQAHWDEGAAHVEAVLKEGGYETRRRERPASPETDLGITWLVYRGPQPASPLLPSKP